MVNLCFHFCKGRSILLPMFFRMRTPGSLSFTILALTLLVLVKIFIIDGIEQYTGQKSPVYNSSIPAPDAQDVVIQEGPATAVIAAPEPVKASPSYFARDMKQLSLNLPQPETIPNTQNVMPASVPVEDKLAAAKDIEAGQQPAPEPKVSTEPMPVHKRETGEPAKIVIIIDDMGLARSHTRSVMDLPAPLTLAFLPYAENLAEFTEPAKAKGHELIIHVPMEAMGGNNLGPAGLKNSMSEEQLKSTLETHIFPSFEGYVGINNHMGSRLTQNAAAMGWIMEELKKRGLYFVDSKTIGSSVAARSARDHGIPYAERDVFLDHYDSPDSVLKALNELERVARRKGVGIAIGHPKSHTIAALKKWMPGMRDRGLELVPASAVLHHPQPAEEKISAASSEPVHAVIPSDNSRVLSEIYGPALPDKPKNHVPVIEFKSISAAKLEAEQNMDNPEPLAQKPRRAINATDRYQQ